MLGHPFQTNHIMQQFNVRFCDHLAFLSSWLLGQTHGTSITFNQIIQICMGLVNVNVRKVMMCHVGYNYKLSFAKLFALWRLHFWLRNNIGLYLYRMIATLYNSHNQEEKQGVRHSSDSTYSRKCSYLTAFTRINSHNSIWSTMFQYLKIWGVVLLVSYTT